MSFDIPEKQLEVIKRGVEELIPEDEMLEKLKRSYAKNLPLKVKQGFDPTAPDIHLGHTVGLRKLRQFQELGHQVVLIIGDYTGMVGDPSGRSSSRPQLSHDEVLANAETYLEQFYKVVDKEKTTVHYNGEWFAKMSFKEVMELASRYTVARILERNDFENRFKQGDPIYVHEFFYPIMQGYDSVMIEADVEIGATEQKFNLMVGRVFQREYGQEPQVILTLPVLEGIDGTQRMSKSTGNYIGISEPAEEIYGKTMSIPDKLIYRYFELVSDVPAGELAEIKGALERDEGANPMELKKRLAYNIVAQFYDDQAASEAAENFANVVQEGNLPDDIPELAYSIGEKIWIIKIMNDAGFISSNSEGRRLIQGGAVELDDKPVETANLDIEINESFILKAGKRKYVRVIIKE